jgi:hypothetical protein
VDRDTIGQRNLCVGQRGHHKDGFSVGDEKFKKKSFREKFYQGHNVQG